MKFNYIVAVTSFLFSAISCHSETAEPETIVERFFTPLDINDNVDSIAIWKNPATSKRLLLATSKNNHKIFTYDAQNGFPISEYGSLGSELGQFSRPNGISIIDNIAFIVERDNHRVQAFAIA